MVGLGCRAAGDKTSKTGEPGVTGNRTRSGEQGQDWRTGQDWGTGSGLDSRVRIGE